MITGKLNVAIPVINSKNNTIVINVSVSIILS